MGEVYAGRVLLHAAMQLDIMSIDLNPTVQLRLAQRFVANANGIPARLITLLTSGSSQATSFMGGRLKDKAPFYVVVEMLENHLREYGKKIAEQLDLRSSGAAGASSGVLGGASTERGGVSAGGGALMTSNGADGFGIGNRLYSSRQGLLPYQPGEGKHLKMRDDFFRMKTLETGDGGKYPTKIFVKAALKVHKKKSGVIKSHLVKTRPAVVVARLEVDAVDRRTRMSSAKLWSGPKRSFCIDSSAKIQVFYGRVSVFVREKKTILGDVQHLFYRFRYPCVPIVLPSLYKSLAAGYQQRDAGLDLLAQVDLNIPQIEINRAEIRDPPPVVKYVATDAHKTNINMHAIGVHRNAILEPKTGRELFCPNSCFQHPLATNLLECQATLLLMLDYDPAAFTRRVVLSAINLQQKSTVIHMDLEQQLQSKEVMKLVESVPSEDVGALEALFELTEQPFEGWEGFELSGGKIVYSAEDHKRRHRGRAIDPMEFEQIRGGRFEALHRVFTPPKKPATNKWFKMGMACMGLLVFGALDYDALAKNWFRSADHVGGGKRINFECGSSEEEMFRQAMIAFLVTGVSFEVLQKRALKSSWRADKISEDAAYRKMFPDLNKQLEKVEGVLPLLFRAVSPKFSTESSAAQFVTELEKLKHAARLAINTGAMSVGGKTMLGRASHIAFVQEFQEAGPSERKKLYEQLLQDYGADPPKQKTEDVGPLVLYKLQLIIRTYPPERQFDVLSAIVLGIAREESTTQPVESEHQDYLREREAGRMGDSRGAARCASVNMSRTIGLGRATAQRQYNQAKKLGERLGVDLAEEREEVGKAAVEDRALSWYNMFAEHIGGTYNMKKMTGPEATAFIKKKFGELSEVEQTKWKKAPAVAKIAARAAALREWDEEFDQLMDQRRLGVTPDGSIYVPAEYLGRAVDLYDELQAAVEEDWGPVSSPVLETEKVEFSKLCDRSLSEPPIPVPSFTTETRGPSLLTRRLVWMSKKCQDPVYRRGKAEKPGGSTNEEEQVEDQGVKCCPEPDEHATHLCVRVEPPHFGVDPGNPADQTEWILITYIWGQPYSWVGRRCSTVATAGVRGEVIVVLAAEESFEDFVSNDGDVKALYLPKEISADEVRSWRTTADRPRPFSIFEVVLGSDAATGDMHIEFLGPELSFTDHNSIREEVVVSKKNCAEETKTGEPEFAAAPKDEFVRRIRRVDIEAVPRLKRSAVGDGDVGAASKEQVVENVPLLRKQPKKRPAPSAGDGPVAASKKAGRKAGLEHSQAFVSGEFGADDFFLGENEDGFPDPPPKKARVIDEDEDVFLLDVPFTTTAPGAAKSSPAAASSSAAAGSADRRDDAANASRAAPVRKKAGLLAAASQAVADEYEAAYEQAVTVLVVGGFQWKPMVHLVEVGNNVADKKPKRKADGGIVVAEKRKTIEAVGEWGKEYKKFVEKLGLIMPGMVGRKKKAFFTAGTKSHSIVDDEPKYSLVFCRSWARMIHTVVKSSTDFMDKKTTKRNFVERNQKDLAEFVEQARYIVESELTFWQVEEPLRGKIMKHCGELLEPENFRTVTTNGLIICDDVEFVGDPGEVTKDEE